MRRQLSDVKKQEWPVPETEKFYETTSMIADEENILPDDGKMYGRRGDNSLPERKYFREIKMSVPVARQFLKK